MKLLEKKIDELYNKGYTLLEISIMLHYDYGYIRKLHMKIRKEQKKNDKVI